MIVERRNSSSMLLNNENSNELNSSSFSRDSIFNDASKKTAPEDKPINNNTHNEQENNSKNQTYYEFHKECNKESEKLRYIVNDKNEKNKLIEQKYIDNFYSNNNIKQGNLIQIEMPNFNQDCTPTVVLKDYEGLSKPKINFSNVLKNNNKLARNETDNLVSVATGYNLKNADTDSTLSDEKKKIVVKIVTIVSVVFFLLCFSMIVYTLRMSEKIDEQSMKKKI